MKTNFALIIDITQVTHVRNRNSYIQGRSHNVIYDKELLIKERIFRESPLNSSTVQGLLPKQLHVENFVTFTYCGDWQVYFWM